MVCEIKCSVNWFLALLRSPCAPMEVSLVTDFYFGCEQWCSWSFVACRSFLIFWYLHSRCSQMLCIIFEHQDCWCCGVFASSRCCAIHCRQHEVERRGLLGKSILSCIQLWKVVMSFVQHHVESHANALIDQNTAEGETIALWMPESAEKVSCRQF